MNLTRAIWRGIHTVAVKAGFPDPIRTRYWTVREDFADSVQRQRSQQQQQHHIADGGGDHYSSSSASLIESQMAQVAQWRENVTMVHRCETCEKGMYRGISGCEVTPGCNMRHCSSCHLRHRLEHGRLSNPILARCTDPKVISMICPLIVHIPENRITNSNNEMGVFEKEFYSSSENIVVYDDYGEPVPGECIMIAEVLKSRSWGNIFHMGKDDLVLLDSHGIMQYMIQRDQNFVRAGMRGGGGWRQGGEDNESSSGDEDDENDDDGDGDNEGSDGSSDNMIWIIPCSSPTMIARILFTLEKQGIDKKNSLVLSISGNPMFEVTSLADARLHFNDVLAYLAKFDHLKKIQELKLLNGETENGANAKEMRIAIEQSETLLALFTWMHMLNENLFSSPGTGTGTQTQTQTHNDSK